MAKTNLKLKILKSLQKHAKDVNEVINDPGFKELSPTIQLSINMYTRTIALTIDNWKILFDENPS